MCLVVPKDKAQSDKRTVHAYTASPATSTTAPWPELEDGDDERSCHGFSSTSPEVDHYSDIEQDPMYAVLLHTIQQRQLLHERQLRLSSTREDFHDLIHLPLRRFLPSSSILGAAASSRRTPQRKKEEGPVKGDELANPCHLRSYY